MRVALALLLVVAGCKAKHDARPALRDGCLVLPGAQRRALRAHDGALYWIERVLGRDYDGLIGSTDRLVRHDLATDTTTVLADGVLGPVHFTPDGVLAVMAAHRLVLLRGGDVQQLLPAWYTVRDVEPIDPERFAVIADADGKRAVYVLELAAPRPWHLVEAGVLLSANRDTVFIRTDDGAYAVDIATGARERRDVPDDALPDGEDIYFVEDGMVRLRSLRTGETSTVLGDVRDWDLRYQQTSVLARHAPPQGETHAVLLDDRAATPLPILTGTSIVGIARVGDQTWALVGHNTSNVDGDLLNDPYEADVCKLDTTKPSLAFTARSVPQRFAATAAALTAAVEQIPNHGSMQVLEYEGEPVTLAIGIDEDGGADLDALRERVRDIHDRVTGLLGDKEIRTSLRFRDGRTAVYRWRRERLRGRAVAGIGDVQLTEPGDFDVEVAEWSNTVEGDHVVCRGKLTNVRRVVLRDLEIRCIAGDRERVIPIATIDPKQTIEFSRQFERRASDYLELEVFHRRTPLVVRDLVQEGTAAALYAYLAALHADTGFALRSHVTEDELWVQFDARRDHLPAADEVAALAKRLEGARALFGLEDDLELSLRIYARKQYYDWDGASLVPVK